MIVLTETTDNLQVVLGGAVTTNQLRCMASWRDVTTTVYTPGRTVTNTNSTTDVNLVPSPGSSTQRVVDFLSVYNADTVAATVTVKFDANGTEYALWSGVLSNGERLEYADGQGFRAFTNIGAEKVQQTIGAPSTTTENLVVLGSDVTNNNASANTLANVTGLAFDVTAGVTYWFDATIPYTAAATTTGSRWTINGPATPTLLAYASEYTLTATSQTVNYATAYLIPAASNATSLTAGNIAYLQGIIKPSANGTVQVQFASEVSSSAVVAKAGAILRYRQIA